MIVGLQGENGDLNNKYLKKKNLKESVANIQKHSGGFRRHARWVAKFRSQYLVFSQLQNQLSAWCNWLPMAITSSFQLRFTYRLKRWILDFLSFEMVYSMQKMDFGKCSKSSQEDCSCCPLFSSLCFSSLQCSFLAYFERLWQRAMELQSLVLHEFELPKALP